MDTFISNISNLIVHLFSIWTYPSFTVLFGFIVTYAAVILVRSIFRGY